MSDRGYGEMTYKEMCVRIESYRKEYKAMSRPEQINTATGLWLRDHINTIARKLNKVDASVGMKYNNKKS